ncbi:hypothetical protein C8R42DRAFT_644913 [Lentinula raphanica]|nr:hypothetical protein C8R42DRAFT_644913 [Lentinula raphanica]
MEVPEARPLLTEGIEDGTRGSKKRCSTLSMKESSAIDCSLKLKAVPSMKPYLKNGRPVYGYIKRQSAQDVDSPIFLCWCDLCAESNQVVVLPTGESSKGRYFYNIYDAKQHQSLLKDLARQSVDASTLSASRQASQVNANPNPTTDNIFEPPLPVTPSVAFPVIPPSEIPPDTPIHVPDSEPINDRPSSPGEDLSSLFTDNPSNTLVKGHLEWLNQNSVLLHGLASLKSSSSAFSCKHTVVKRALDKEMENTRRKLNEELARREKINLLNQRYIHLSSHHGKTIQPEQQIFLVILMVVAVLHLLYDLSMVPTAFLLGSMRLICATMGHDPKQIQLHLPQDVRVVVDRLDLSPSYTTWTFQTIVPIPWL